MPSWYKTLVYQEEWTLLSVEVIEKTQHSCLHLVVVNMLLSIMMLMKFVNLIVMTQGTRVFIDLPLYAKLCNVTSTILKLHVHVCIALQNKIS